MSTFKSLVHLQTRYLRARIQQESCWKRRDLNSAHVMMNETTRAAHTCVTPELSGCERRSCDDERNDLVLSSRHHYGQSE